MTKSTREKVLGLVREAGVLRPRDLEAHRIPRVYLSRLCRDGVVERVGRGLYRIAGAPFTGKESYAEACKRVPNGVICLLSALQFHEFTTQAPFQIWMAIPHEVEEEDDKGRKTGKRFLIFPRYHQLDAVRRLVAHAREHGPGQRYLIQHSAGSGKSNSIAWLAHQLSILHDAEDRRVFDSIVVVTDRLVLDRQLQRTVRQFEQTVGVVENIDTTSRQLKEALESGKAIIVTTSWPTSFRPASTSPCSIPCTWTRSWAA